VALIVTLFQNPDGVAGATYRKQQLRNRRRSESGPRQPRLAVRGKEP
jgi:hypothetical protein